MTPREPALPAHQGSRPKAHNDTDEPSRHRYRGRWGPRELLKPQPPATNEPQALSVGGRRREPTTGIKRLSPPLFSPPFLPRRQRGWGLGGFGGGGAGQKSIHSLPPINATGKRNSGCTVTVPVVIALSQNKGVPVLRMPVGNDRRVGGHLGEPDLPASWGEQGRGHHVHPFSGVAAQDVAHWQLGGGFQGSDQHPQRVQIALQIIPACREVKADAMGEQLRWQEAVRPKRGKGTAGRARRAAAYRERAKTTKAQAISSRLTRARCSASWSQSSQEQSSCCNPAKADGAACYHRKGQPLRSSVSGDGHVNGGK